MFGMSEDPHNFEETLRAMARELGESVERAMEQVDLDDIAGKIGVDPDRAKEWMSSAGSWLRAQTEAFSEEHEPLFREPEPPFREPEPPFREREPHRETEPAPPHTAGEARGFPTAAPHPLDMPSDDQGAALAALDSGRWTVEPGTNALAAHGQGPGPSDALGLVRELRVRDWIAADGEITVAGRHALKRWLEAGSPR
jgi:hypothetical protein